ncbi:MAG: hypothetical protein HC939_11380 [Pleurocapsa sp. SU_5_0]|nr:hypothetical protein [Pleurocapsa sp. SU_5_0]
MSSRFYRSYKFFYDNDLGQTIIKRHRSYLDESGSFEETPTTTLFLNRVVNIAEKVTGTSQGLRHVRAYVGTRQLIAKIPYAPTDSRLVDHVREILAQPQVKYLSKMNYTNIRAKR